MGTGSAEPALRAYHIDEGVVTACYIVKHALTKYRFLLLWLLAIVTLGCSKKAMKCTQELM